MCGINGVYNFSGESPGREIIRLMNNKMYHRGPDDEGEYFHGPVSLGMRRLAIIDIQSGYQPISNENKSIWVILNGEIYNYLELKIDLESKGHHFYTATDTEVIVHLYEEEGISGIQKLNGMFSFALYDEVKKGLWIARDRLGIKPLFYSLSDDNLIFSSDLIAISEAIKTKNINFEGFLSYLAFAHLPQDISIFENINKLPSGHWIWVDSLGIKIEKYWDVTQFQNWKGSISEAQEQLDYLLDDSVKIQLRSDVPIGITLSGGVDSSAVTAYARKNLCDLTTFSLNFLGKNAQDAFYAQLVADKFKAKHIEVQFSSEEILLYVNELLPAMDEPVADSAIMAQYALSKRAKNEGIKVLLNGAGGDEIFGGYSRHHSPSFGSTIWFSESLPRVLRNMISPMIGQFEKDKSLRMQDPRIAYGAACSGVNLAIFNQIFKRGDHFHGLTNQFLDKLGVLLSGGNGLSSTYNRMFVDLKHYLVGNILALTDKATMACSIEGRVPLLDHRLVEFAYSLPNSVNILHGRSKGLFKEVLKTMLPSEVLHRKKEGFNAPMSLWARNEFSQELNRELVVDTIPFYKEIFCIEKLSRWVYSTKKTSSLGNTLFSLYLFSRWYRFHVME